MRVLIADDSNLLADRLMAALAEESGIEIVGRVSTAAQASEAIRKLKPEVVILDICMPGGSGMDVLERMQGDHSDPVVIVFTNYGQPQYRKKCLESGAAFFLDKSAEFGEVVEVLRNLVLGTPAMAGAPYGGSDAEKEDSGKGPRLHLGGRTPSLQEGEATTGKPKLVISHVSRNEPIYYVCSYCLRGFLLPDNTPPMQAMRKLLESFRVHVKQDHPEADNGAKLESAT